MTWTSDFKFCSPIALVLFTLTSHGKSATHYESWYEWMRHLIKKVPKSRLSVSRQDQRKVIAVSLLSELENRRDHLTVVGFRYWKQSKVSEVFSQNGSVAPYWGLNPRPLSRLCGVFVWLLSNSCFVLKEERRTFDLFSIVYAENLQFLWVLVTSFQCMPLIRLKGLNTHPYCHGFTPINTSLTSLKTLT